jgi:hypothetical protein
MFFPALLSLFLYQAEVHRVRRLSTLHTFLDQICLPDELLNQRFSHLIFRIVLRATPSYLDHHKQYLNTANGVSVTYTVKQRVKMQPWIRVYGEDTRNVSSYVINNNTWAKVIPDNGAECVDIHGLTSPTFDESLLRLYAEYTIQLYWVL